MKVSDYDDLVSKQAGGRLSKKDAQRARYGSKLDEERHHYWQAAGRFLRHAVALGTLAAAAASVYKFWKGG